MTPAAAQTTSAKPAIEARTLRLLELDKVLTRLEGAASCELGRVRARADALGASTAQSSAADLVELARLKRHLDPHADVRSLYELALQRSPEYPAALRGLVPCLAEEDREGKLRAEWREFVEQPAMKIGLPPPRLHIVSSEFRSMTAPVLRAVAEARHRCPHRPVTVILPELVEGRWWGYLMHTNRERRLRARLLRDGGADVAVSTVPWQLRPADPAQAIAAEEPSAPASAVDRRAGNG